jgi:acetyl-CoA carboxylase biotin carboxyl carrier protein
VIGGGTLRIEVMNRERLEELIRIAEEYDLEEIEVTEGDSAIRIRRRCAVQPAVDEAIPPERPATERTVESVEESKGLVAIDSPIVGTFYRAPSPDAETYVEVNDEIEVGQVVCIVEAMKLMNEIQSNVAGRVVTIPVENAEPVEYGQPLFWIDPREPSTASKR